MFGPNFCFTLGGELEALGRSIALPPGAPGKGTDF